MKRLLRSGDSNAGVYIFAVYILDIEGGCERLLRARPKAERVFAEYDNFLNLSDPTDRPDPTGTLFSVLYLLNQAND